MFLARHQGREYLERFWQLFVGGIGEKSGTTWVQLMLDSHPNITCRGESNFPALLNHIGELKKRHDHISKTATHDYHRHGFTLPERGLINVWAAYVTNSMLPNINEATRFVIDKSPNKRSFGRVPPGYLSRKRRLRPKPSRPVSEAVG